VIDGEVEERYMKLVETRICAGVLKLSLEHLLSSVVVRSTYAHFDTGFPSSLISISSNDLENLCSNQKVFRQDFKFPLGD
jgi:hypothetical protein